MAEKPKTVYANMLQVRTTPAELVMDFGCMFASTPDQAIGPDQFESDVRVILSISGARQYIESLVKAIDDHEKAIAAASQQKQPASKQA